MPKICYQSKRFGKFSQSIITMANSIIEEYQKQNFTLTLRQLYYQFVARGAIPNSEKIYGKLSSVISDGRLAGLIDWEAIEDRTRPSRGNAHWENPQQIINAAAKQFRLDTRATQETYIEVWIEKMPYWVFWKMENKCLAICHFFFSWGRIGTPRLPLHSIFMLAKTKAIGQMVLMLHRSFRRGNKQTPIGLKNLMAGNNTNL